MSLTYNAFERLVQHKWISHLTFWVLTVLGSTLVLGQAHPDFESALMQNLILLPPKMLAAYTLIYFQIYQLIFKRRYLLFVLSFILSAYLYSAMGRFLMVYVFEEFYREGVFYQEPIWEIMTDVMKLMGRYVLYIYMFPMILAILTLIRQQLVTRQGQESLEKEKAVAELKFLKAQIHPHFLFNTLNNLYVLTLQKSDKAPEMLIKLSDMLDYMLYKCNVPVISLEKELGLIQNYLDLEKVRYGDRLNLKFEKDVDNLQTHIAPLLLLPMIENAFKHGASSAIQQPEIHISLKVQEQQLQLDVYNTKPLVPQEDPTNYKQGIGMANIRKQLKITYPKAHEIEIVETEEAYAVTLHVNLNKYQR